MLVPMNSFDKFLISRTYVFLYLSPFAQFSGKITAKIIEDLSTCSKV